MRYFVTLILMVTSFWSFSQTELDSLNALNLNEINYRSFNGIKKVTFDTITFRSFSQTQLDRLNSLILNEINNHRSSKGIKKVTFDTIAFRCASVQSDSMSIKGYVGHNNYGEFKTLSNRFKFFGGDIRNYKIAEVCNFISINAKNDSVYLKKIAIKVVNSWANSEEHNKILLDIKYDFVGVSSKAFKNKTGLKNFTHYQVYSTAVFVK